MTTLPDLTVVVAVPLAPKAIEGLLRRAPEGVRVVHEPELLPAARWPGDHRGEEDFARSTEQQERWETLLREADVLLGIPGDEPEGLAWVIRGCPRLGWVQATADGAGQVVSASGLSAAELDGVVITKATGIHDGPLAEFCLFGLLAFAKQLPRLLQDRREHRWQKRPVGELRGRTLLLLGLGPIGLEVARLARAFGMRTVGVSRSGTSASDVLDAVHATGELAELLPGCDALVSSLPLTGETRGLLDAEALGRLPEQAVVVNVGRGPVIDEEALVAALREGRLTGAALDVTAEEPPPDDSPLWTLDNVLLSPHTAALTPAEDERIVALFTENLVRWLAGEPLAGRVDPWRAY